MGAEIDRLEVQVETQATKANNQLDKLVTKLDRVSGALSGLNNSGLTELSNGISKFTQASSQLSNVKTADFTRLTKNIQSLVNLNTQQLYSAAASMKTLSTAINSLGGVSASSLQVAQVSKDISKLGGANVQRAIANLPALAIGMKNFMATMATAPQVSNNIIQMTAALAGLAAQGSKVGTVSNALTQNVNRVGNAMSINAKKAKGFSSVIGSLYQKFFWVSRGIDKLWDSAENSMNYVETLNYFDAAFGQVANVAISQWEEAGYDSADAYYNSFSNRAKELTSKMTGFTINDDGTLSATGEASLGLNPSKLMNYQAMFAQMSSSMGVASETSLKLSQALTEIGADLASVKNMDFDKVWKDMASGLAGMSRTLDKYGVNIRNVNLQQKLFDLGINENITNLNQNDKALLRTIILLEDTTYAWGDLADTLDQPANQMRLLDSNLSNLSRTLGNLFLPALSKVLPYVNGLVIAGQRLLSWVGSLMGINLSKITSSIGSSEVDMSELLGETDDLTGSLDDASASAKKLKSNLQGFDELNVITTKDDSGILGGGNGLSSGILDEAFDDAFSKYQKVWDEAFANMENRANEFADKFERYLQPVKEIITDFAIGDIFKAGQDTSKLATSIIKFFGRAIDDINWKFVGDKIGDFLEGINWTEVIKSGFELKFNIWKAIAEAWFSAFDAAPIETAVLTGLALCKFTGVGDVIWTKLAANLGIAGGMSGIDKVTGGFALAATVYVGFKFVEDANNWWDNIKKYGWDEGRRKSAEENTANPYRNGNAVVQEDGSGIFDPLAQELKEFDEWWRENAPLAWLPDWWTNDVVPWFEEEKWRNLGHNAKSALSGKWDEFTLWWQDTGIPNWWDDNVEPWFTKEKWQEFGENAKTGLSDKWTEFTDWWKTTGLYKWWNEEVEPYFSKDTWSWDGIKDGLSEAWNSAIESLKGLWNRFAEWINDKLTFDIDTSSIIGKGISEILGTSTISFGSLPTYSVGGFPEDGLFMANRGELVGRFANGRTAVANNEQITAGFAEAVYPAVYNAVYAALKNNESTSSHPEIRVYVGDRELTDIAIDGINERTKTTGQTPIFLW